MLAQALNATQKLLLFRAGPQDFPYQRQLGTWIFAAAVAVYAAQWAMLFAPAASLLLAVLNVACIVLFVQATLTIRKLPSRSQQTWQALVAALAALTVVLMIPFSQLAPELLEYMALSEEELKNNPPQPNISGSATVLIYGVSIWRFAICANIFRHALNSSLFVGALTSALFELVQFFFLILSVPLATALTNSGLRV